MDYNHWSAVGVLGELLPWEDNRVELSDHVDSRGQKVAKVTYRLRENDKNLIRFAVQKTESILRAAGATEVVQEARYAHLVGGARMGLDPSTSVVDKFGGAHDVPNLFVCDGSILPTQGSANPGLTIQALAARTSDHLTEQAMNLFAGRPREMNEPRLHEENAPRHARKKHGMPVL